MTKILKDLTKNEIRAEENALMDFQFAIIDALNEKGLSQSQFAEMLGVSAARVSQMLSSEANPTIKLVGRALLLLDLKASYFPRNKEKRSESSDNHKKVFKREFEAICSATWKYQDQLSPANDHKLTGSLIKMLEVA
jgi:transcriptional regulator with XRE-family HTH domain